MLIHRNLLNAAAVSTKNDTRFRLDAVHARVKEGRVVVEATDGHCAIRLSQPIVDPQDYPARGHACEILASGVESLVIPAEEAKRLHGATPRNGHLPILRSVPVGMLNGRPAGFATDLSSDTMRTWDLPEGTTFPNTDRVGFLRSEDEYGQRITFDATLMRRVLDTIIKADRERDGYSKSAPTLVTLAVPKANPDTSAFHVRAEQSSDGWSAEALVMPCRI